MLKELKNHSCGTGLFFFSLQKRTRGQKVRLQISIRLSHKKRNVLEDRSITNGLRLQRSRPRLVTKKNFLTLRNGGIGCLVKW